jgi:hypothetical protein
MFALITLGLMLVALGLEQSVRAAEGHKPRKPNDGSSPAVMTAKRFAEAVAAGDRVTAAQSDFACLHRLVAGSSQRLSSFPAQSDRFYADCWAQLVEAHQPAVEYREPGLDVLWPGKGSLVFFREDLGRYPASAFVMDLLGLSPPAGGLQVEYLASNPLPASSFKIRDEGPMVAAPATLVQLRIRYKDPLTSPVTYAAGAYKWTNTVKRPRQALKSVTLQVVVLSGLKKLGFPTDTAVVNLPVEPAQQASDGTSHPAVPFLTVSSGYVPNSASPWQAQDAPGVLLAAVGRTVQFPDQRDRLAMLNRILLVDPSQPEALSTLTRDIYETILAAAATTHKLSVPDPTLAERFNELYWDVYAQTWRMDLSLGMEVGGLTRPTPADYLYRLIPAMEMLARVRPEDIQNRLRLGTAYRWNNDQLPAIETHERLVRDIPSTHSAARARALIELAMSRIARVSWNRTFDDPGILQAYKEAEEALTLTDHPLDKFAAAYTMAYSLAFMPQRDNEAMLKHLQEARQWYLQLAGATPESWRYLLANDTLKGVIEADPSFKPLLAGV